LPVLVLPPPPHPKRRPNETRRRSPAVIGRKFIKESQRFHLFFSPKDMGRAQASSSAAPDRGPRGALQAARFARPRTASGKTWIGRRGIQGKGWVAIFPDEKCTVEAGVWGSRKVHAAGHRRRLREGSGGSGWSAFCGQNRGKAAAAPDIDTSYEIPT
jgi:hypothetical protein